MKNIKEIEKEFDKQFPFWRSGQKCCQEPTTNKLYDLKSFIRQAIKDALESCVPEEKKMFKWDYKEGDGERKDGFNQAISEMRDNINKFLDEPYELAIHR